jgi:hypothetical protein
MRALGLALALAACGGIEANPVAPAAAVMAPAQKELGLYPGEAMAFEVKLAGVLVGEAQLAVGEPGLVDGKHAVVVRSRAATAGAAALLKRISDEATSLIDTATGAPISVDTEVWNGDRHTTAHSTFQGTTAKIRYQRNDAKPIDLVVDFKTNQLHDSHTAMAQVRSWRGEAGDRRTLYVVGGRRMWRVDVTYVGPDTIGTELGNRKAIVFEGVSYKVRKNLEVDEKAPSRTFRVWLSDDADRVPLRVAAKTELGEVEMALTDYQRP